MDTLPVPYEIITKIFLLCLSDDEELHPSRAPILLSQICREWRETALAIPQLWSKLHLPFTERSDIIPALQMWLEASGNLPLTFDAILTTSPVRAGDSISSRTEKQILCSHSQRWYQVRLILRSESSLEIFNANLPDNPFPILRCTQLRVLTPRHYAGIRTESWNFTLLERLSSSPYLQTLAIENWRQFATFDQLPCSSLRHLWCCSISNTSFDVGKLTGALRHCDHLTSLHLEMTALSHLVLDVATPTHLPRLETLSLSFENFLFLADVINALYTPHLRALRLQVQVDMYTPESVVPFAQMLTDCASSLKMLELSLRRTIYREPSVTSAIANLRNLTSLTLDHVWFTEGVITLFNSLALPVSPDNMFIRSAHNLVLDQLYVGCEQGFQYENYSQPFQFRFFESLANLVASRWDLPPDATCSDGSPIHRLSLFNMGGVWVDDWENCNPEAYRRVSKCWDEGLGGRPESFDQKSIHQSVTGQSVFGQSSSGHITFGQT